MNKLDISKARTKGEEKSTEIAIPSSRRGSQVAAQLPVRGEGRRRVLVVEDEAIIALDLERRLTRLGFEVVGVADNGNDAVALFEQSRPDLVLMDIWIHGDRDGIETARELGGLGDAPVVFLTAYADDDTVKRAAEISPYGYLLKPFDEQALGATLTVALERHAADTRARLLGAAVEGALIGIVLVEARGAQREIVFVNDAFAAMAGLPRELMLGQTPCFLAEDGKQEQVLLLRGAIAQGVAASGVIRGKRANGERFWSSVSVSPVPDAAGRVTHLLIFHADITKQREAEAALEESQRLEVVGRLTAGIAHDFNSVLGAITAFADLAREGVDDEQRCADLDEIAHSARRGAMLTRKLLDFSRRGDQAPENISDLSRVIAEARPMFERLVGPGVSFEFQLDGDPMLVRVDATSVEQIMMNLVANARDAMPQGGRVRVSATRPGSPSGGFEARCYARLSVADSGVGMDEPTLIRIFEPLFTTKPRGEGTGLGLATCKMLVDRAGGSITVQSAPGEGTTFTIDLPLSEGLVGLAPERPSLPARPAPPRAPAAVEPRPVSTPGRPAVLLVEDDALLRRAITRVLEGRGLRVLPAGSGAEALAIGAGTLALALIDVRLPDASGLDVLASLRRRDGLLPALMMTGDPSIEAAQRSIRARAAGYLTKPIEPRILIEEVERAISEGQVARLQHRLLLAKTGGELCLDLVETGHQLDEALRGLSMVYQPIVRCHDRSIFAFEALMRCRSESLPNPLRVLAAADALGRVDELGRAIRAHIAATLRANPGRGEPIFVNIHPTELRSELLTAPDEPLLPFASRIVLEVTEHAQLGSPRDLEGVTQELRAAGYRVALDDLGEGYAGLSWLVKLAPDVAKLDLSLIRDIHTSRLKRELVSSLIGVCRQARTLIVAEGVEQAAEAAVLDDLGCDLLQGFLLARPGPPFPALA